MTFKIIMPETNISNNEKINKRLWALMQAGAFTDCLNLSKSILQMNPKDSNARMFEGNCLKELGRYEEAIDSLTICISLEPSMSPSIAIRGEAYMKLKKFDKALKDFETVLSVLDLPMIRQQAAVCYHHFKDHEKAHQYIDQAIEGGADGNALAQKAHFYDKEMDYKNALIYYRKAQKELPGDNYIKKRIRELSS